MNDYLLFTLYSPLSSWGEIAVGEVRASKTHPGRSAIFGLIAGALGIRRDDSASIGLLHENYKLGVKVLSMGTMINDFQTIQAARSQKKADYHTRSEELHADKEAIGTLISTREYRSDGLYIIAIWCHSQNQPYSLSHIKKALEFPTFVPYLGRKSCPPAWNYDAKIVSAKTTLRDAFEEYNIAIAACSPARSFTPGEIIYFWDDCDNHGFAEYKIHSIERYDSLCNSSRRQFNSRREHMAIIKARKE